MGTGEKSTQAQEGEEAAEGRPGGRALFVLSGRLAFKI
jgi:hypothetical protein